MPWCPKCKLEYREGIESCADCGTPLVNEIGEDAASFLIMTTHDEALAQKFLNFLEYSGITSGEKLQLEETDEYTISVAEKDSKQAQKLFQGFYITEVTEATVINNSSPEDDGVSEENPDAEATQEKEEISPEASLRTRTNVYIKREDKYKDLSSTANIFYLFGVGGLIYLALNLAGILTFVSGIFSYSIYAILFIGCLIVGFTTKKSAKIAKEQIADENSLTETINQWMTDHITEDYLTDLEDDSLSEEINFLNKINHTKKLLTTEFPDLDDSYADQLIEDYLDNM